jgi:hypothetical protein
MVSRKKESAPRAAQPDPGNNLGRGASQDREERVRQRAHEMWEPEGRPEGQAQNHWDRAAQVLDRKDAENRHEGDADQKPSTKPAKKSNDDQDSTTT